MRKGTKVVRHRTPENIERVLTMHREGKSIHAMVMATGIARTTIRRILATVKDDHDERLARAIGISVEKVHEVLSEQQILELVSASRTRCVQLLPTAAEAIRTALEKGDGRLGLDLHKEMGAFPEPPKVTFNFQVDPRFQALTALTELPKAKVEPNGDDEEEPADPTMPTEVNREQGTSTAQAEPDSAVLSRS